MIARLEGYVFGVGMELSLACDFRLAAEGMQMALPEARNFLRFIVIIFSADDASL